MRRRRLPLLVATALCVTLTAGLLTGCGGKKKTATTTIEGIPPIPTFPVPKTCTSWGPAFVTRFNKMATREHDPTRMLSACCESTERAGIHHCFLQVGLEGTASVGCETVDIGAGNRPAGPGRYEECSKHPELITKPR